MRLLFLFLVNVVLAALALYLFLRLGLVLFGETAALIAGPGFALYPPLIMYSGDFGTESLFLVLLMAIFLTFYQPGKYRFGEQGSTWNTRRGSSQYRASSARAEVVPVHGFEHEALKVPRLRPEIVAGPVRIFEFGKANIVDLLRKV